MSNGSARWTSPSEKLFTGGSPISMFIPVRLRMQCIERFRIKNAHERLFAPDFTAQQ